MTLAFPDSAFRASRHTVSAALLLALAMPYAAFAQGTPVPGGTLTWGVETGPHAESATER